MSNLVQNKESIYAGCHLRTCCYYYRVTITGFDMWRISRTLHIPWGLGRDPLRGVDSDGESRGVGPGGAVAGRPEGGR